MDTDTKTILNLTGEFDLPDYLLDEAQEILEPEATFDLDDPKAIAAGLAEFAEITDGLIVVLPAPAAIVAVRRALPGAEIVIL